jgi:N-acetylglucosamine kinase-like BadF-type ATPase
LLRWTQAATREQVAQLARIASTAATAGDQVSATLVEEAAQHLAAHASALLGRMGASLPAAIALAGGLLTADSAVRARLIAALERVAPGIPIKEISVDPAMGAATIALRL